MSTLSSMLPLFPIPTSQCPPDSLPTAQTPQRAVGVLQTRCAPCPQDQIPPQSCAERVLCAPWPAQLPAYISARACREELERGEAVDFHCLHFISRRVHLGNDNVLVVPVGFSQLVPDWGQLLAVTTPRGIC